MMAAAPLYVRSVSAFAKRVRLDLRPATTLSSTSSLSARHWSVSQRSISSKSILQATSLQDRKLSRFQAESPGLRQLELGIDEPRLPRSVQAAYLRPLRRRAEHAVPACDLQLRSYSARNLELMTDFALRAAYYLDLPASGPVPLPRLVERWTVSRSNFVHKKSQENFERKTLRRLVQIQDGHPETVQVWLAFLRKHAYYGVGMKANIWEHEKLGVGKEMDVKLERLKQIIDPKWAHFGRRKNPQTAEQVMEMMHSTQLRRVDDGPMQYR